MKDSECFRYNGLMTGEENEGAEVVEFPLHRRFETDGIAPQERTVMPLARAVIEKGMHDAIVETETIPGIRDLTGFKAEAVRLDSGGVAKPHLEAVPPEDS